MNSCARRRRRRQKQKYAIIITFNKDMSCLPVMNEDQVMTRVTWCTINSLSSMRPYLTSHQKSDIKIQKDRVKKEKRERYIYIK